MWDWIFGGLLVSFVVAYLMYTLVPSASGREDLTESFERAKKKEKE